MVPSFKEFYTFYERYPGDNPYNPIQALRNSNDVYIYRKPGPTGPESFYISTAEPHAVNHILKATIHPLRNHSIFEIVVQPNFRTTALHLFRYKEYVDEDAPVPIPTEFCSRVSKLAVQGVAKYIINLLDTLQPELRDRVKIVCMHSNTSPFNNKVETLIHQKYPNKQIVQLNKLTLQDVRPEALVTNQAATNNPEHSFIQVMYRIVRNEHLADVFSREQVARWIAEKTNELDEANNITYDDGTGLITITINPTQQYAVTFGVRRQAQFNSMISNITIRAGTIIAQTETNVVANHNGIAPGDAVIFYDDNISVGFTETQIRAKLAQMRATVILNGIIFGISVRRAQG